MAQNLFEQIGPMQAGSALAIRASLAVWRSVRSFGFFAQRIAGALELADPLMSWRGRAVLAGPAGAASGLGARQRPRVVPGSAPLGILL
jgi:hypothetical protein